MDWWEAPGAPNGIISDGTTTLKNESVTLVAKGRKVLQKFSLSYCPRKNGGVERLRKEQSRVVRYIFRSCNFRQSNAQIFSRSYK